MNIEFDCSGCKTALRLPDDMAGLRAQCVKCGEVLTIPSPTAHYWPPGSQQAAAQLLAASTSSSIARPAVAAAPTKPSAEPLPASVCDTVTDLAELSETIVMPKLAPSGASGVQGVTTTRGTPARSGDVVKGAGNVHGGSGSPAAASPSPAASGIHPRPGAARPIVLAPSPHEKKAAAHQPQPI